MLNNTPNQASKFKIKNWIEINNESRGMYYKDNQIRFKTSMLRSSLCDYSNGPTVENTEGAGTAVNNASNKVIFKICAPFFNWIGRRNSAQVNDAHDIVVGMRMYNLK